MKVARKKMNCEVPSVAMGDIAFNLLIFFVILAKAQDDSHLRWQAAVTPKVESAGNSRVSILVDVNNKLYLNGREIGISQLKPGIEKELRDAPAGQRTVVLMVQKDTQANRFQPIIEAVSVADG